MRAVFYRDSEGREPVREFVEALPTEGREELRSMIGLLNQLGPNAPPLPFPLSSQVEGQLRELRCHYGRDLYRILYQRSDSLFILLHIVPSCCTSCRSTRERFPTLTSKSPRSAGMISGRGWMIPIDARPGP